MNETQCNLYFIDSLEIIAYGNRVACKIITVLIKVERNTVAILGFKM